MTNEKTETLFPSLETPALTYLMHSEFWFDLTLCILHGLVHGVFAVASLRRHRLVDISTALSPFVCHHQCLIPGSGIAKLRMGTKKYGPERGGIHGSRDGDLASSLAAADARMAWRGEDEEGVTPR